VNAAFAPRFAGGFMALRPGRVPGPSTEPAVELLLTDTDGWDDVDLGGLPPAQAWRHAEARLLAQRVAELVESGAAAPEDVVVLLRAVGSLPVFERALQDVGLPTLAVGGRGYWGRQVVRDLCGWLAILANPRDEIALYGVLASPPVGASTDALALVGETGPARQGHAWQAIAEAFLTQDGTELTRRLEADDRERLRAFAVRFQAERAVASRLGLDELIERIVAAADYDVHVLSLPNGERRLANVHKLQRLAADHEREHGRDVRAFVDLANAELEAEAREADAPVELGDLRAVRLMTIHAAKGLEFDVVVVGDLGRRGNTQTPDLLVDGDRLGLRLALLDGRNATPALAYEELRDRRLLAESQEEDRVFYVALTRARERLILSGAADPSRWPREAPGCPPLAWLGPALVPDVAERLSAATPETAVTTPDDGSVRVVLNTPATLGAALRDDFRAPGAEVAGGAAPDEPAMPSDVPPAAAAPPAVAPVVPVPGPLSYTALAAYQRCGYRFYTQRILGLPDVAPPGGPGRGGRRRGGLDARERGVLTHALIEELDFARGVAPPPERAAALAARLGLDAGATDLGRARESVAAFAASDLAARLAAAPRLRREHEFAFDLEPGAGPLLTGAVDLVAVEADGGWLIVDTKTDAVSGHADLAAIVDAEYAVQRDLYALAALRAGAPRVEVAYAFLARPGEPVAARFTRDDEPELAARLAEPAAGIARGDFVPTALPHAGLCATCPARERLCPHPRELKLRAVGRAQA
jgi:ATP-dependent helicase/nuclease subunit A